MFNLTVQTTEATEARAATEEGGEEGRRGEREEADSNEGSLSPPQSREGSVSPPRDRGLSCVDETRPRGISLEPLPLSQPYVMARHKEVNKLQRKLGVTTEEGGEDGDEVRLYPLTPFTGDDPNDRRPFGTGALRWLDISATDNPHVHAPVPHRVWTAGGGTSAARILRSLQWREQAWREFSEEAVIS